VRPPDFVEGGSDAVSRRQFVAELRRELCLALGGAGDCAGRLVELDFERAPDVPAVVELRGEGLFALRQAGALGGSRPMRASDVVERGSGLGDRLLESRAGGALLLQLVRERCLTLGGELSCGQTIGRRSILGLAERCLRGLQPPLGGLAGRRGFGELGGQLRLADRKRLQLRRARGHTLQGRAQRGLDLPRLSGCGRERRLVPFFCGVARRQSIAERALDGAALVDFFRDPLLELARSIGKQRGDPAPLLCAARLGCLQRRVGLCDAAFEELVRRRRRLDLRGQLGVALGQPVEVSGRRRVIPTRLFDSERGFAELLVHHLPRRRRSCHRDLVLRPALCELAGGIGHGRLMDALGRLEGCGGLHQLLFRFVDRERD
jgi:hypothetical protein